MGKVMGLASMPGRWYMAAWWSPPRKDRPQQASSGKPRPSLHGILPRHRMHSCAMHPLSAQSM